MNNEKKNNLFVKSYIDSWKRIFDYKGVSSRYQYWSVVIADVILFAVTFVLACAYALVEAKEIIIVVRILEVIAILSMLPLISLTVRRLKDAGKNEWWTCLILAIGIGTIILMFMCSGSTVDNSFNPEQNFVEEVYGPPELMLELDEENNTWNDENIDEEFTVTIPETPNEPSNNDTDFEPELNVNEDVYGPPIFDDEDVVIIEGTDEFEESENMNTLVYGPPEVFENMQDVEVSNDGVTGSHKD